MTWRLVTHEALTETLHSVETFMCVDDVCEAHTVLDQIDEARRRQARG